MENVVKEIQPAIVGKGMCTHSKSKMGSKQDCLMKEPGHRLIQDRAVLAEIALSEA
jgi:hypothetical protein